MHLSADAAAAGVVARDVPIHDGDGNFVDTNDEVITTLDAEGNPVLADGQELQVLDTVSAENFSDAVAAQEDAPDPASYAGWVLLRFPIR